MRKFRGGGYDSSFEICESLLRTFGSIGVAGFFLLSGHNYCHHNNHSFGEFWKRKALSIGISWIVWGVINTLIKVVFLHSMVDISDIFIGWTGSWYLVSLVVFWFVFWKARSSKRILIFLAIVSVAMQVCYGLLPEYMPVDVTWNPLVWAFWFIVGMRYDEYMQAIYKRKIRWLFVALAIPVFLMGYAMNVTYASLVFIPFAIFMLMALHIIGYEIESHKSVPDLIKEVSNNTLVILYCNFFLVLLICKGLLRIFNMGWVVLTAPIITVILVYVAIKMCKVITKRLNCNFVLKCVGIR